jgi:hypothetical protein
VAQGGDWGAIIMEVMASQSPEATIVQAVTSSGHGEDAVRGDLPKWCQKALVAVLSYSPTSKEVSASTSRLQY